MGKKRQKRLLKNHEQHHAAIHQWIIQRKVEAGDFGDIIPEHHVIPTHQNWHVPHTSCVCFPRRVGLPDAQTGADVWFHNGWIN